MYYYSIVIPFYKYEERLKILLESLFQSFNASYIKKEVQLIIVNDSPEYHIDATILKNLSTECHKQISIEFMSNKTNLGVAKSRNIGRTQAKGKFLSFIDQDDFVSKNYFEVLFTILSDKYDLFILNAYHFWEESTLKVPIFYIRPKFTLFNIIRGNFILTPGLIVYKKDFLSNEFISYDKYYTGSDDWALYLKILNESNPRIKFINKRIYNYITHQFNESGDQIKFIGSSLLTISKFRSKKHIIIQKIKIYFLRQEFNFLLSQKKNIGKKYFHNGYFASFNKLLGISVNNLIYITFKYYKIIFK